MLRDMAVVCVLTCLLTCPAVGAWDVLEARWRPDANPFADEQVWEDFFWAEGWSHPEQFYPHHFRPAGSVHVLLRNDSTGERKLALTHIDGEPVEEVTTTPTRTARVIYHFVDPPTVPPRGSAECVVRLRSVPDEPVTLRFQADGDAGFDIVVPDTPPRVRFESIAFSSAIDRVYVYLRSLDNAPIPGGRLSLDGVELDNEQVRWVPGPAGSGLALIEAALEPAWLPGSFHLVSVAWPNGERLAFRIRAWDHHFAIGLFGDRDEPCVRAAREHGFDTYYTPGPAPVFDELGMNYILTGGYGQGRQRTATQSGTLFLYNLDEPDAHDCMEITTLPWMDRLGVNAMHKVLPILRQQREAAPNVPNLVLTDNTYKPANWYVYGQIADIYCTDPYVPISAEQLERVPTSLRVAHDACSPHPLTAIIWATGNTGHPWAQRPPTPDEERMMVFYALGCGIKGLGYFADYDLEAEGGRFFALRHNAPLLAEVKNINADVRALADHLAVACPVPGDYGHRHVWVSSLMAGPDRIIVVVVNKRHEIAYNTVGHHPVHLVAHDVDLSVPVPPHFADCTVQEVRQGQFVEAAAYVENARLRLSLDTIDTARVFIVTAAR